MLKFSIDDYLPIAHEIRNIVDDKFLNIMFIDFGGFRLQKYVCEALKSVGMPFKYHILKQDDRYEKGYRPIIGIKSKKSNKELIIPIEQIKIRKSDNILVVDDNIHIGNSIIGGVVYCLENRPLMGNFHKLYILVDLDERGNMAYFARRRNTDEFKNFNEVFKEIAPRKYKELEKGGLLNFIAVK